MGWTRTSFAWCHRNIMLHWMISIRSSHNICIEYPGSKHNILQESFDVTQILCDIEWILQAICMMVRWWQYNGVAAELHLIIGLSLLIAWKILRIVQKCFLFFFFFVSTHTHTHTHTAIFNFNFSPYHYSVTKTLSRFGDQPWSNQSVQFFIYIQENKRGTTHINYTNTGRHWYDKCFSLITINRVLIVHKCIYIYILMHHCLLFPFGQNPGLP